MSAPARLQVSDLLYQADEIAAQVLDGCHAHLWPDGGLPKSDRWFALVHRDAEHEIYLISWAPRQPVGLNSHGASVGAFTVISGAIVETRWDGKGLRLRRLEAGDQAGIGLGVIHDIVGAPRALTVHVYAPPLTAMPRYEIAGNTLRAIATAPGIIDT